MSELGAKDAAAMSREEALRTLANAEDAPEKDRRIAKIMLAGPEISFTEEQRLLGFKPKRLPMVAADRGALRQIGEDWGREQEQVRGEVAELAGL